MSFEYINLMPTVDEIKENIPVPADLIKVKAARDAEIKAVFESESDKFLLIIGPCSADNEDAVCDYISRLARVQEKVQENILLIPRIYTNKPRTKGTGYKGMLHQPDPTKDPDLAEGLQSIRRMHIRALSESGLSSADEMLYPSNYPYLDDILSYVAVGARSVENQHHRLTASGVDIPVGMKNPTSGDLGVMFNAIAAAQASHIFVYNGYEAKTSGNDLTHSILRGYVNDSGEHRPNYHYEDLRRTADMYEEFELMNPSIVVDVNHSNSGKKYKEQIRISKEILYSRRYDSRLKKTIKGLMIESYIEEGTQKIGEDIYGKSITDPCIGWADTESLILEIAEGL